MKNISIAIIQHYQVSWGIRIVTAHQAAGHMVSTTAETLEINMQKLLLLLLYKQQVGFDTEQTGPGVTPSVAGEQTSFTG